MDAATGAGVPGVAAGTGAGAAAGAGAVACVALLEGKAGLCVIADRPAVVRAAEYLAAQPEGIVFKRAALIASLFISLS